MEAEAGGKQRTRSVVRRSSACRGQGEQEGPRAREDGENLCRAPFLARAPSPLPGSVAVLSSWRGFCSGCGHSGLWAAAAPSSALLPRHSGHHTHEILECAPTVPELRGPLVPMARRPSARWTRVQKLLDIGSWCLEEGEGGFSSSLIQVHKQYLRPSISASLISLGWVHP